LQTTRLAESFKHLNSSLPLTVLELCPCKATCEQAVFTRTVWIKCQVIQENVWPQ